jgi:hypothetical protein
MKVYESISNASKDSGISQDMITKCCTGICQSGGKLENERVIWAYYNENKIYKYIPLSSHPNNKRIICVTTSKVFDSIKKASDFYNIGIASIGDCCRGRRKSGGKINGEKAIWKYI